MLLLPAVLPFATLVVLLFAASGKAAMDPARFQVAGYGPQPGDLGAQVEVSGGEVQVPLPLEHDSELEARDERHSGAVAVGVADT